MSEKPGKKRVSATLTKPYLDALDRLIREEIYINRAEVVRDALRCLFRHYGIEILEPLEGGEKDQQV